MDEKLDELRTLLDQEPTKQTTESEMLSALAAHSYDPEAAAKQIIAAAEDTKKTELSGRLKELDCDIYNDLQLAHFLTHNQWDVETAAENAHQNALDWGALDNVE